MITESLQEYMSKVRIINDKISEYRDEEKGLIYPLNTTQLIARVDYLELTKEELQKAKFEQRVDNKDYQMLLKARDDVLEFLPKLLGDKEEYQKDSERDRQKDLPHREKISFQMNHSLKQRHL